MICPSPSAPGSIAEPPSCEIIDAFLDGIDAQQCQYQLGGINGLSNDNPRLGATKKSVLCKTG